MWAVYEFLDTRRDGAIHVWLKKERVQRTAMIRLDQKIDLLRKYGPDLPPGLLSPGPIDGGHIYKLKIHGSVMFRPLLCKGPISMNTEYTLLRGAIERDNVLPPSDIARAEEDRQFLIADNTRRQPWKLK